MLTTRENVAAFTATAIFNINSTLIIDLYPSKPASATAIVCIPFRALLVTPVLIRPLQNNLVRCTLGAIGVGVIEKGIAAVDEGPMFLALSAIAMVSTVLVMLGRTKGPRWRMERLERIRQEAESEGRA